MRKYFFVLFFASFIVLQLHAQNIRYARSVIDTLCSPSMHGRGYVNNGDQIAAAYIDSEYKKDSLLSFSTGYFQSFFLPVCTLPGKVAVGLGKNKMIPAVDYLVSPSSPTTQGWYKIVRLDSVLVSHAASLKKFLSGNYSKKFILLDRKGISDKNILDIFDAIEYNNILNAKGVITIEDKLIWEASDALKQSSPPRITIKRSSFQKKAKKISLDIEQETQAAHEFHNVAGFIEGKTKPDSFIVFTAHYDHLGQMGADTYFPGANDNASGTAMLLDLAKYYSEHKPGYSVVFIALTGEELGLVGSEYFVNHSLFPLTRIRFLINLDLEGTGDDGIKVVNGAVFAKEFELMKKINDEKKYLPSVNKRGEAAISDHYPFYAKGVKAFYLYTLGGIAEYHNIYDKAQTLPLTRYNEVFKLITDFVNALNLN
jgi:aminopeptidase YwaD